MSQELKNQQEQWEAFASEQAHQEDAGFARRSIPNGHSGMSLGQLTAFTRQAAFAGA